MPLVSHLYKCNQHVNRTHHKQLMKNTPPRISIHIEKHLKPTPIQSTPLLDLIKSLLSSLYILFSPFLSLHDTPPPSMSPYILSFVKFVLSWDQTSKYTATMLEDNSIFTIYALSHLLYSTFLNWPKKHGIGYQHDICIIQQ